jgi:hypothetical protein
VRTDAEKIEAIREVLSNLGDPEFWSSDQLGAAIDKIDNIIDPEEGE